MFLHAFYKYASQFGIDIVQDFREADVFFLFHIDAEGPVIVQESTSNVVTIDTHLLKPEGIGFTEAIKLKRSHQKLILRVNECDDRKGTSHVDSQLVNVSKHLDQTIFVSRWMRDYFLKKGWEGGKISVLVNGVDSEIFSKKASKKNEKTRIVTHHWSSHPFKGEDLHVWLGNFAGRYSDKFEYTYIGRTNVTIPNANYVQPLYGRALADKLKENDVYVSASKNDPGPNHILESLSCGIPTYVSSDGGGCVEFAGVDHVYETYEQLENILLSRHYKPNRVLDLQD